jgi:hypothetical protein
LDYCKQPEPTPIDRPCNYKTPCQCLANINEKCGWCQTDGSVYTADGSSQSFVSGWCGPLSLMDKCSGSPTAGGYLGSFSTVAPNGCSDDSTDPSIKDTSAYFTDSTFKQYFSDINSGTLKEEAVQKIVDTYKTATGCDFSIKRILKADANSDETGTVSTLIEIYSVGKDSTEASICDAILEGYSATLGIPKTCFKKCELLPYTPAGTTTPAKRALTSGQYIQSATVDPGTTGSVGTLAPMWMMIFVIFLFFRM